MKTAALILFLLFTFNANIGCGIDIDAEGVLDSKFFELYPVVSTCAEIDILCRTSQAPPFDSIQDFETVCFVALDIWASREEMECVAFSSSCEEAQHCPLAEDSDVVYSFLHTQETE